MRKRKISIEVVPLSVAQKALAEELKRIATPDRTRQSRLRVTKSGQK